jgi:hypothetical protein
MNPSIDEVLVIGYWLLVIGHWSLVIGHWSLVIGHWSFDKQQTTNDKSKI